MVLVVQNQEPDQEDEPTVAREKSRATFWHHVNLVCDPVFSGLRTMNVDLTYNLWELGEFSAGDYLVEIRCDVAQEKLHLSYRSLDEAGAKTLHRVFGLYVDPGNKCLHLELVEATEATPSPGPTVLIKPPALDGSDIAGKLQAPSDTPRPRTPTRPGKVEKPHFSYSVMLVCRLIHRFSADGENIRSFRAKVRRVQRPPRADSRHGRRANEARLERIESIVQSAVAFIQRRLANFQKPAAYGNSNHGKKGQKTSVKQGGFGSSERGPHRGKRNNLSVNDGDDSQGDGQDDDDNGPGDQSGVTGATKDGMRPRNLACPFWRQNPAKFCTWKPCNGRGWPHVHRVK
jgi:hypothetical protein